MDKHVTAWLRRHELDDALATSVLATRLAVRWRARLVGSIMLALLFIVAALVQTFQLTTEDYGPLRPTLLVVLAVFVGGLVVTQFLLDRWVRRVDQRIGATLSRRATHPVHPGWRSVVGRSHAALGIGSFLGAVALAVSALTVTDPVVRYGALVLLTGVCGVGAVVAVQLRHLLSRPVVADDAASLTADVIMRIEDARDTNVPSVLWSLPMVLLFGMAPGWWGAAALAFMLAGLIGLVVVQMRTPGSAATARQVVGVR
ncbi:hypothetical protein [Virgisporangium aurantiacum]|uniref:Uncharacterized protein n=1 Tax=Virgisporangium aurantiacum TaxID=175570 RepID=A0A8J3Z5Q0_9ACTN|nr:hypothetical protein [Virgisporangium aurantiacum]GIJ57824.1 hypothetical protein Vau01_053400 [Virgisporangium aurantiacum]